MKISIYKTHKNHYLLIKVNDFYYKMKKWVDLIEVANDYEEYFFDFFDLNDYVEIELFEILFNTKMINHIIKAIINTIKYQNGFRSYEYFDIEKPNSDKVLTISEEEHKRCFKCIYNELIKYSDLKLFDETFLKEKERIENKYNLLEK